MQCPQRPRLSKLGRPWSPPDAAPGPVRCRLARGAPSTWRPPGARTRTAAGLRETLGSLRLQGGTTVPGHPVGLPFWGSRARADRPGRLGSVATLDRDRWRASHVA